MHTATPVKVAISICLLCVSLWLGNMYYSWSNRILNEADLVRVKERTDGCISRAVKNRNDRYLFDQLNSDDPEVKEKYLKIMEKECWVESEMMIKNNEGVGLVFTFLIVISIFFSIAVWFDDWRC